jgi:hypothetical protein
MLSAVGWTALWEEALAKELALPIVLPLEDVMSSDDNNKYHIYTPEQKRKFPLEGA